MMKHAKAKAATHAPAEPDATNALPVFQAERPEQMRITINQIMKENEQQRTAQLEQNGVPTWKTWQVFEDMEDRLHAAWSLLSHLYHVVDSPKLRAAHNDCLPKISEYMAKTRQDKRLYAFYCALADKSHDASAATQMALQLILLSFRLSGVDLPANERENLKNLQKELAILGARFSENLQDATDNWRYHVTKTADLAGLPPSAMDLAKQLAEREGESSGWLVNLEAPSYFSVMHHAHSAKLRKRLYLAYITRASNKGTHAGRWDNGSVIPQIIEIRREIANLLGFTSYADYALVNRMEEKPKHILQFLHTLVDQVRPAALAEMAKLQHFAQTALALDSMQPWDIAYASERYKEHCFGVNQEQLRAYFPLPRVLDGIFALLQSVFGITWTVQKGTKTWHDGVICYAIHDQRNQLRGNVYMDLHARSHKRGGAWMEECRVRRKTQGIIQLPIAFLICNFTPPERDRPALLTPDEVCTLLHEIGHCLHHVLTLMEHADISGTNGTPWDAIELPSQFMENFFWEKEVLALISGHHQTGAPIDEKLHTSIIMAKNFQAGMRLARQLEFALFDLCLHTMKKSASSTAIQSLLDNIRARIAVTPHIANDRFQNGFSHIFAGGYAAGYYSYLWAEVLSADAFSLFKEKGVLDADTGRHFLHTVLEAGGSRRPQELFVRFRGRAPRIEALLDSYGIAASPVKKHKRASHVAPGKDAPTPSS